MEADGSSNFYWKSPPIVLQLAFETFGHRYFSSFVTYIFLPKEQEEEMSCWEGAEGGASRAQRHQSESDMGHSFLCDDAKLDGLPGPKFRSLRHLRQVNNRSFSATRSLILHLRFNETRQLKISTSAAHVSSVHMCSLLCINQSGFALQVLGAAEFRQLVWHVLMGNQVIWRGAEPGLIQSAFTVLKVRPISGFVRVRVHGVKGVQLASS